MSLRRVTFWDDDTTDSRSFALQQLFVVDGVPLRDSEPKRERHACWVGKFDSVAHIGHGVAVALEGGFALPLPL